MTGHPDSIASEATETRRIPGRVFVPFFLFFLISAIAGTILLFLHMRPSIQAARAQTFPLQMSFDAQCVERGATAGIDIHSRGSCPSSASIRLVAQSPGAAAHHVTVAIVGADANEPIPTGTLVPGVAAEVPLVGLVPGSHAAVFVVSDKPSDPDELKDAIRAARATVGDRLVAAEQFATVLRHRQIDVRVERLAFRVDEAR